MRHDPLVTLGFILLVINAVMGTVAVTFGLWPLALAGALRDT